ncbi:MAG: hypothetical protein K0Q55_4106 [Verrucomicrobia bacterium]|nr:hypothetical protein [Verrucomicrobiota bacterium]
MFRAPAEQKGATNAPITQGTIVARIIGPSAPTAQTALPAKPGHIKNFWVTLHVVDTKDFFASELKGKTIRLPSCAFDSKLLGQILSLRVSHSPGRYEGSDYWLMCTSVAAAHLAASLPSSK